MTFDRKLTGMDIILQEYFGFSMFRPLQQDIINTILEGRDSLVVMPTGSGRSLCYKMPPIMANNIAVVIGLDLSLMKHKATDLTQMGIKTMFCPTTSGLVERLNKKHISGDMNSFALKSEILYMTPEVALGLSPSCWQQILKDPGICLLAVDEAHCISETGSRERYKNLSTLRKLLPKVPFVGLASMATKKVQADIVRLLKLNDPNIAIGLLDRKELFYGAIPVGSYVDTLVAQISKYTAICESTIVYCTTSKDVEEITNSLCKAGIGALMYHDQMEDFMLDFSLRSFLGEEPQVMVTNTSVKMGIDKPETIHVIHCGCSKTLESYYQETACWVQYGIASDCWLYFRTSDLVKDEPEVSLTVKKYCIEGTCRRKYLLEHLGESYASTNCGNCDNCTTVDLSKEAFFLISCIEASQGRRGFGVAINILQGSCDQRDEEHHHHNHPYYGYGKYYPANWWKNLGLQLITKGYLVTTKEDEKRVVRVSVKGREFLDSCGTDHQSPLHLPSEFGGNADIMAGSGHDDLSQAEENPSKLLLEWRMKLAKDVSKPPYAICDDLTLKNIVATRPSSVAMLENIDGVNKHLVTKYGDDLLQIIQQSKKMKPSFEGVGVDANREVHVKQEKPKNLRHAKYEAWKMWQVCGLSAKQIASYPGRWAPIKEQTVLGYVLDAALKGCDIEWARLLKEIGLTKEIVANIKAAIATVGSKDMLKPIKDKLPKEVDYAHIKAWLAMLVLGMSTEAISSGI